MTLQRINPPPPDDDLPHNQRRARRPRTERVLTLAPKNKRVWGGVIGGLALYLGADVVALRVAYVVMCIVSAGVTALGYPVLWWLLPNPSPADANDHSDISTTPTPPPEQRSTSGTEHPS